MAGRPVWKYETPGMKCRASFHDIALNGDATRCAVIDRSRAQLEIWSLRDGRWVSQGAVPDLQARALTFAMVDGKEWIVAGDYQPTLRLIDPANLQMDRLPVLAKNLFSDIAVVPDRPFAIANNFDGRSYCVDLVRRKLMWTFPEPCFGCRDGRTLSREGKWLDVETGRVVPDNLSERPWVEHCVLDRRGAIVLTEEGVRSKGTITRLSQVGEKTVIENDVNAHSLVAYDAETCLVGMHSGELGVVRNDRFEILKSFRPHYDAIRGISVSPTGVFATASTDGRIGLWADLKGTPLGMPHGGTDWRGHVVLSEVHDGRLVLGFQDGTLAGIALANGEETWKLRLDRPPLRAVPSGDRLLVAAREHLYDIDAKQGRLRRAIPVPIEEPVALTAIGNDAAGLLDKSDQIAIVSLGERADAPVRQSFHRVDADTIAFWPTAKLLIVTALEDKPDPLEDDIDSATFARFHRLADDRRSQQQTARLELATSLNASIMPLFGSLGPRWIDAGKQGLYVVTGHSGVSQSLLRFDPKGPTVAEVFWLNNDHMSAGIDFDPETGTLFLGIRQSVCAIPTDDRKGARRSVRRIEATPELIDRSTIATHEGLIEWLRYVKGTGLVAVSSDGVAALHPWPG